MAPFLQVLFDVSTCLGLVLSCVRPVGVALDNISPLGELSPIPTFGLFMSLTLVGLLSSRADPDCHNVSSSLQVWCSYLLLSIVLIMQQLAVCK